MQGIKKGYAIPRIMIFALTTPQFIARTKTVTRRLGWKFLKPGELVWGVEKAMGLKKGEKIKRLGLIRIVSNQPEHLHKISHDDVAKEGFPEMSRIEFIDFFCAHNRCDPDIVVRRIEFEYVRNQNSEKDFAERANLPFDGENINCSELVIF